MYLKNRFKLKKNATAMVACASMLMGATNAVGQTIINDDFNNGAIGTNTGAGSGFNELTALNGTVDESGTTAKLRGGANNNGGHRAQIGSKETFNANSATVTGTFVISDFGRPVTQGNGTARFFVGFADTVETGGLGTTSGSTLEQVGDGPIDGLWVSLQSREDQNGLPNGMGGLHYVDGVTVTNLATWEWNQSLVAWDSMSVMARSDRIMTNLTDDDVLTLILTSDSVGYSLKFDTTGDGILPTDVSGTWASAGVTNDLNEVHAAAHLQGNHTARLDVDRINVTIVNVTIVPEPPAYLLLCSMLVAFRGKLNRLKEI